MFEKIKQWHTQGLWNTQMVNNAVLKGKIIGKRTFIEQKLHDLGL